RAHALSTRSSAGARRCTSCWGNGMVTACRAKASKIAKLRSLLSACWRCGSCVHTKSVMGMPLSPNAPSSTDGRGSASTSGCERAASSMAARAAEVRAVLDAHRHGDAGHRVPMAPIHDLLLQEVGVRHEDADVVAGPDLGAAGPDAL